MTLTPDQLAVLADRLREAGLDEATIAVTLAVVGAGRVMQWHVRCVDAYVAALPDRNALADYRLLDDLQFSLDRLHSEAQWEDARRTARVREVARGGS